MPTFIQLPVEVDASALAELGHEHLARQVEGYVPADASIESALIGAVALQEAGVADLAQRAATNIFRYFGGSLLRLPALEPARAVASSTWTAADADGYCMPLSTRCLTRSGWKSHNAIVSGDETLGYNTSSGRTEWTPIRSVHRFPEQPVVELANNSWRAVCTSQHRWAGTRRVTRRHTKLDAMLVANSLSYDDMIRVAAPAVGGESALSPQEAALIGWLECDGRVHGDLTGDTSGGTIYQSKPRGVKGLETVLAGVPHSRHRIRYRERTNYPSRAYGLSAGYLRALQERAGLRQGWEKFVLGLTAEARGAFLQACIDAEGHQASGLNKQTVWFTQKPGAFNDAVRLAMYLSGVRPGNGKLDASGVQATALCRPRVGASSLRVRDAGCQPVWCPETELGTWTALGSDGQIMLTGNSIPAGTRVGIAGPEGELAFEVVGEVLIPPGSTVTSAGEVQLVAVEPGTAGAGLPGPASPIDALAWVASITLTAPSARGTDGESDAAYLDRLVGLLRLLSPRTIVPADFAALARSVAGVDRAAAIDNLDPATGTTNNERMVAVAVVGADGEELPALVKGEVDALLQAEREANFIVWVIDPTYTQVAVTFTAVAYPGFAAGEVQTAAISAIASYLSPANWGLPRFGDERVWINETVVRYLELAEVLNRVEGLHYVTALTLGVQGQVQAAANLGIPGYAPLVRAGTIDGTVTGGS